MTIRHPIRDLHTNKKTPDRFCDVVVEDGVTYLVQKRQQKYIKIPWKDFVDQVEGAIKEYKKE